VPRYLGLKGQDMPGIYCGSRIGYGKRADFYGYFN
jgi:hypothetical protein